jgi:DNA invertase Pin-like site-specific DNA recombinase
MRQPERPEPLTVRVAGFPAVDTAEQPFPRQQRRQVRLDVGPCPVRDPCKAIPRPGLRAAGPHLPRALVHVRIDEREDGGDLEPSAVGERKDGAEGEGCSFDHAARIGQLEELTAGRRCPRCSHVAGGIDGQDAELTQVGREAADCGEVLALRGAGDGTRGLSILRASRVLGARDALRREGRSGGEPPRDRRRGELGPEKRGADMGEVAVALTRGAVVARTFTDEGVSGSVPLEERPAGRELVQLLKRGDVLILAKLDRGFGSAGDALARADAWKKQGVRLVADMGTDAVTDNGAAKMFFGMLALVAEFERDRIRERTAEGRASKRARGGHIGGPAPFGYRVDGEGRAAQLVAVPEQQAALATIRELAGQQSLRKIAPAVEAQHGFPLSPEMVRRIIARGLGG